MGETIEGSLFFKSDASPDTVFAPSDAGPLRGDASLIRTLTRS